MKVKAYVLKDNNGLFISGRGPTEHIQYASFFTYDPTVEGFTAIPVTIEWFE